MRLAERAIAEVSTVISTSKRVVSASEQQALLTPQARHALVSRLTRTEQRAQALLSSDDILPVGIGWTQPATLDAIYPLRLSSFIGRTAVDVGRTRRDGTPRRNPYAQRPLQSDTSTRTYRIHHPLRPPYKSLDLWRLSSIQTGFNSWLTSLPLSSGMPGKSSIRVVLSHSGLTSRLPGIAIRSPMTVGTTPSA